MKRYHALLLMFFLVGVAGLVASARRTAAAPAPQQDSRTFEFSYKVHFPARSNVTGPVHLWIPSPTRADPHQTPASSISVTETVKHTMGRDPEYGDEFTVFHPTPAQVASGFDTGIKFTVTRKEYAVLRDGVVLKRASSAPPSAKMLQRYLRPDKMVPLHGVIAELAKEHTVGAKTPIEKARQIYDYVVSTMHYDKSGEGWGRGDAVWACDSKRGNCTDFHSVFIGMMRASGIPARFEIGFPLPEGKTEGEIPGYHCWAEFYIEGTGWIPVDASEASKNPAKKDYFFGTLDVNRVLFTYGRDIRLSPDQKGDALNYFIYPYAEANGQPVPNLQRSFSFREVPAFQPAAAGR